MGFFRAFAAPLCAAGGFGTAPEKGGPPALEVGGFEAWAEALGTGRGGAGGRTPLGGGACLLGGGGFGAGGGGGGSELIEPCPIQRRYQA